MAQIYLYRFKTLTLAQKILFFLTLGAIIALSFLLFGLVVTILFYLFITFITIATAGYIYGKIKNFLQRRNQQKSAESNPQSPENVIINAEVISVEVSEKKN